MPFLIDRSIALILDHQAASGAYITSPSFSTYAFSWLRDGSCIANAIDCVGQHYSVARFHRWSPIAHPLLWSNAMLLIHEDALQRQAMEGAAR